MVRARGKQVQPLGNVAPASSSAPSRLSERGYGWGPCRAAGWVGAGLRALLTLNPGSLSECCWWLGPS